jgi:hypothetical protein
MAAASPPSPALPNRPSSPNPGPRGAGRAGRRRHADRFACFVTGTDTEIGKTLVSSAILHKLVQRGQRACGMKPIAPAPRMRDGELHNDDAAMLRAAGNVNLPQHITTPFMLREPCAPHIAAALEGVTIEPVPIMPPMPRSWPRRTPPWSKAWAASACRSPTISTAPTWPCK